MKLPTGTQSGNADPFVVVQNRLRRLADAIDTVAGERGDPEAEARALTALEAQIVAPLAEEAARIFDELDLADFSAALLSPRWRPHPARHWWRSDGSWPELKVVLARGVQWLDLITLARMLLLGSDGRLYVATAPLLSEPADDSAEGQRPEYYGVPVRRGRVRYKDFTDFFQRKVSIVTPVPLQNAGVGAGFSPEMISRALEIAVLEAADRHRLKRAYIAARAAEFEPGAIGSIVTEVS